MYGCKCVYVCMYAYKRVCVSLCEPGQSGYLNLILSGLANCWHGFDEENNLRK